MGKKRNNLDPIFDLITILLVISSVLVLGASLLIAANPQVPFNPLPPPTLPSLKQIPTATPTYTPSATFTASATPTQTTTPLPTLTPTPSPSPTPSHTLTPTRTPSHTPTPTTTATPVLPNLPTTLPTATINMPLPPTQSESGIQPNNALSANPSDEFPFGVSDITYQANSNAQGCDWASIGGTVNGLGGEPILGMTIQAANDDISLVGISGTAPLFGTSGFEIQMGNQPSTTTVEVWLMDERGQAASGFVTVQLRNNCTENVALVRFRQVR